MIDTKEVREKLDKWAYEDPGWYGSTIEALCDELDALHKPVEDCPMCAGAGVVERWVAYSDKVDDPCPACARINVLEAENRRLREDLTKQTASLKR